MTRYILLELLKVFLLTLTGLTALIMVTLVGVEAMRQGLGVGPVLRLIPYVLPQSLCFSVPGTVLFAACSVYGRLSAANEVVALKSLGISPLQAIWPGWLLALALSIIGVYLNEIAFSWGHQGLQRVVIQSVEEIAYGVLRTQRTYSTERFAISVKEVDGKRLLRPTITFSSGGDAPPVTITAQEARMESDLERNTLRIVLTTGLIEYGDRGSMVFPDTFEQVIPLSDASRRGMSNSPSHLSWSRIHQTIPQQKQKIRELQQSQAAEAAFAMVTGDLAALETQGWEHRDAELDAARVYLSRLYTEPWRRWASGFSCLCFMCVGAPLAIWLRQADFMTNFFVCFFPILIGYYPFFLVSLDLAKAGDIPGFCVWIGNVGCIAVGLWLTNKVLKH